MLPSIVLRVLHVLILTTILWDHKHYHLHFINKRMESWRTLSNCQSCMAGLWQARIPAQASNSESMTLASALYYFQFSLASTLYYFQFSSVQLLSRVWLCDPMNRSTPGLPVHHQLQEFKQTHVHWVSDAIQPSHPLLSPSPPAPNPSQTQGLFQWVNYLHEVAKVLEFQPQHQSFQWTPRTGLL